ncbi:MAG: hypothetical protein ACK4Q5_14320 [Saprospiraceae bacterium]
MLPHFFTAAPHVRPLRFCKKIPAAPLGTAIKHAAISLRFILIVSEGQTFNRFFNQKPILPALQPTAERPLDTQRAGGASCPLAFFSGMRNETLGKSFLNSHPSSLKKGGNFFIVAVCSCRRVGAGIFLG